MSDRKVSIELELLNGEYLAKIKKSKTESEKYFQSFEKGINNLASSWGKFAGLGGMSILASQLMNVGRSIVDLANQAGRIQSIEVAFRSMTASYGEAANDIVRSTAQAARGTVSNLDIMRNANLAMQLMGQDAIKELPEMTRIAMSAARAQGKDVSQMMEDIIVASGRRSVMILDNLGISSAQAAKYQEEFAAKLGLTREKLNDTQKSQAFFYAVMKAGGEVVDRVGTSALTLGEKLQVLKTQGENTKNAFLRGLTPVMNDLLGSLLGASGGFDVLAFNIGRTIGLMARFVKATYHSYKMMVEFYMAIAKIPQAIKEGNLDIITAGIESTFKDARANINNIIGDIQNWDTVSAEFVNKAIIRNQNMANSLANINAKRKKGVDLEKQAEKERQANIAATQTVLSNANVFMAEENKKLFKFGQALAIAQIMVNQGLAISKVWAQWGWPMGAVASGIVGTAMALQIRQVKKQKPPAYETGSWFVPKTEPAIVHRGEMIIPKQQADAVRGGGMSGGQNITNNYLVNADDFIGMIDKRQGERAANMGAEIYPTRSVYE